MVRQHLEGKLQELAGIAARYVPEDAHARYLAEVRLALGDAADAPEPGGQVVKEQAQKV